jgi:hypothetical protein
MLTVAMDWQLIMHLDMDDERHMLTTDGTGFTMEVKLLTFLVEAYQAKTLIDLAKLSWNEDIDGAGGLIEWNDRVLAAMNYATDYAKQHMVLTEDQDDQ